MTPSSSLPLFPLPHSPHRGQVIDLKGSFSPKEPLHVLKPWVVLPRVQQEKCIHMVQNGKLPKKQFQKDVRSPFEVPQVAYHYASRLIQLESIAVSWVGEQSNLLAGQLSQHIRSLC